MPQLGKPSPQPEKFVCCNEEPTDLNQDPACVYVCSVISDSATPWSAACQAPLSMEFSRQEYWSGLPFSPPGDLPDPEIKLMSPALTGRFFTTEPSGKAQDQA